jgi:tetratricopeptide (TPR) repeat protein
MRRWLVALCLSVVSLGLPAPLRAQPDEAAKANIIFNQGKHVDALPFYEDLAKANPNERLYQERLAVCLAAKALQTSDPAEAKALRTRQRDAARRAVELGDKANYIVLMAAMDPDAPVEFAPASPGGALLEEAEKAFSAGDFTTAMAKYIAAADADPQLYQAPLYAGDTAYEQGDYPTAAKWFARAIAVDPNRETAYRYWGDAMMRIQHDPAAAREKFIDALVAEPYNRFAWQGLQQWAVIERAVILPPAIDRPAGPTVDPNNPKNVTINIDPSLADDKAHPGSSAWMTYSLVRASYRGDLFKKEFPNEPQYRHSLKEEDAALSAVVESLNAQKISREKLDESLRNLLDLDKAGMLDCWILINGADAGIAQDYAAYRDTHRQLLHDYISNYVVHGGIPPEAEN